MNAEFRARSDAFIAWLMDKALPLWWDKGADHVGGGFFELLSLQGEPVAAPRRARVQARQVYSYAVAGRMGWSGPWRDAVHHGLAFFLTHYRRPDGLFRTLVKDDGSPADDTAWLYDQAFALLALAEAARAFPENDNLRPLAKATLQALVALKAPSGGFGEASPDHPYQSNPIMHLLEAALAWSEIDDDPAWPTLADDLVNLALGHFIDRGGAIHEFFSEDWSFETSIAGRIIEPGHQFEWAWLLERWSRLRRDPRAHAAAKRLFEIGTTAGVDRDRGVAVDQLLDDHSLFKANARLWPQTERIKAWLIFQTSGLDERPLDQEGIFALSGLQQYLSVPLQGLWRDKLGADGRFVDEPAPASSLYHIVCAAAEIQAAMTDPDAQP